MIILSCLSCGIFLYILARDTDSLMIETKNIQKLKLTKSITQRDLKISLVEDVQFCCCGGACKNK